MKTKKTINILLTTICILSFAACNNDSITETAPEVLTYTPKLQGVIGVIDDESISKTKAGIVENNPNYATQGEQFYWENGGQVKVLFFKDGNLASTPTELIYTAVEKGIKSNTCDFTSNGSLPAGNYAVYALYPASGWTKSGDNYIVKSSDQIFSPTDASSRYLTKEMFMKAKSNITVAADGSNSASLSFKHLSSIVRMHLDINSSLGMKLNSIQFDVRKNSTYILSAFPTEASLQGGIDGDELIPVSGKAVQFLTIYSRTNDLASDLFFSVLPTNAFENTAYLYIQGGLNNDSGIEISGHLTGSANYNGLSFADQVSFLKGGFKGGKSYYFNLKHTD